jgi:hypothetical protein
MRVYKHRSILQWIEDKILYIQGCWTCWRNVDIKIKEYNEKEIGRWRGDGETEKKK